MIDLHERLEAEGYTVRTDRYVKGGRGRFALSDEWVVIPDAALWEWLDGFTAQTFHLLARSNETGIVWNMPSVQKRVQNSRFTGKVQNVGMPQSSRKAQRFGTYCPHRVNERGDDGRRSWKCYNVVAVRIGQVDYIPESVDRWLNGGACPLPRGKGGR